MPRDGSGKSDNTPDAGHNIILGAGGQEPKVHLPDFCTV